MTTIQELDIQMRRTGQCFSEYLRMAESFRLVRESSATEKISPASSLYENRKLPVRQTGIPPLKGNALFDAAERAVNQSIKSGTTEVQAFSSLAR